MTLHGKARKGYGQPGKTVPPVAGEVFRAYDIRGIVDQQLTAESIQEIGRGIGTEARAAGITSLLLGFDGRLSSPDFSEALIAGLCSTGCKLLNLGLVPTPLLYYATHTTAITSGVMLTASHNPANYNGLKIVFERSCLTANQLQSIRRRVEQRDYASGSGTLSELSITEAYIEDVASRIKLRSQPRIVIDCGNAVAAVVAPALFERLGCEVIPLFCELDGHFPNHPPDPTVAGNLVQLKEAVLRNKADLGLAFDGDGDRMGLVTENGEAIAADRLLMLLAEHIMPAYPGEALVYDVKCSRALPDLAARLGAVPVMHNSGHTLMKQKMEETRAPLGGEFAAHFFIRDRWFGFDDGLYSAARIVEILSGLPHPASAAFAQAHTDAITPEFRLPIAESEKFSFMEKLRELADFPEARVISIDGLRIEFPHGWGLIRASNTSPALSLRFEAKNEETLQQIKAQFKALIHRVDTSIDLDF